MKLVSAQISSEVALEMHDLEHKYLPQHVVHFSYYNFQIQTGYIRSLCTVVHTHTLSSMLCL